MKQQPKRFGVATGGLASNVPHLHAIGTQLIPLQRDKKYGADWISQYVEKFDLPRSTLFEAIKLAKYFPGENLKQLQTLEWAKVRILLKVAYRRTRTELMQRAIENGWTVKRLAAEKVRKVGRRRARGGAPQSVDLHTDLAKLTEKTRGWCHFVNTVWLEGRIGSLSRDFPEVEQMFALLRRSKKVMQQLIDRLEKRRLAPEK